MTMRIDRALGGNPFGVDEFQCLRAASKLRDFRPINHTTPWSDLSPIAQFVFKALFISICHQFNWDFLQDAMASWLLPDPHLNLDRLARIRSSDLHKLLSNYSKPERIRAHQRAKMLRTTAAELRGLLEGGGLGALFHEPRLDGPGGLYHLMRSVSAFAEDDLEKKVRVLAHDLFRERILIFRDPQNLRPAIEYHILRLYVRSGRVYATDRSIDEQLRYRGVEARARFVKLLRRSAEQAMNLTASYADLDIATLNFIEWQIGRSVCTSETPHCSAPPPRGLSADVSQLFSEHCLYADFCGSRLEPKHRLYHEPQFQKAIY